MGTFGVYAFFIIIIIFFIVIFIATENWGVGDKMVLLFSKGK